MEWFVCEQMRWKSLSEETRYLTVNRMRMFVLTVNDIVNVFNDTMSYDNNNTVQISNDNNNYKLQ